MNYIPTWNPPDPPQEKETKECPYCQGENTFLHFFADEAHNIEVWHCADCDFDFNVEIEIPF